jgi:Uma2 family endonuclease
MAVPEPVILTEAQIAAIRAGLRETDGVPLDSPWHRMNMNLLIDVLVWHRRGRKDYYVGGDMFIYYERVPSRKGSSFRGPDFFVVEGVDGSRERKFWWVVDENDRLPDVIVELLSPTTEKEDKTTKKDIYEQVFRTAEYFWYNPDTKELAGWRLVNGKYESIGPDENGRLWSEQLGLWLGTWEGFFQEKHATWLRFFDSGGNPVLTKAEFESVRAEAEKRRADEEIERAKKERQRAEEEKQRADILEAELKKLQALLKEKGIQP